MQKEGYIDRKRLIDVMAVQTTRDSFRYPCFRTNTHLSTKVEDCFMVDERYVGDSSNRSALRLLASLNKIQTTFNMQTESREMNLWAREFDTPWW